MKPHLLRCSAAAVLVTALTNTAYAEQDPAAVTDTPAGSTTALAPKPTIEEDLVYLKDIVALQTLRLDEAEELIARQAALIEMQSKQIQALNHTVTAMNGEGPRYASVVGEYKVKSGDTLSSIARRNNTTVSELAQANNLRAPYPLRAGATIKLPGQPAPMQVAAAEPAQTPAQPAPSVAAKTENTQQAPAQTQTASATTSASQSGTAPRPTQVAANTAQSAPSKDDDKRDDSLPTEVGVRPEEEDDRPYLAIASDIGGILTPRGTMFVEPAIDYTVASDNRFFFQGIEIIDAVLIGAIEATDTDRRAITESLSVKYGLTNRLEIDARVPYVSRTDRISGVAIDDATTTIRDLDGSGLGDVEMGLHYQLNNGRKLPYAIANLRVKAPTGTGPFEVERNPDNGVETELAQGSGFWTIEPSLTFILSSDPASLYANFGYQYNRPTSPNVFITQSEPFTSRLVEFDPGDAIRTSIGVGLSLNERLSMNFGYDQSFFLRSKNEFEITTRPRLLEQDTDEMGAPIFDTNGDPVLVPIVDGEGNFIYGAAETTLTFSESPATTVGSFLFGGSYAVSNRLRINLSGAIGATDEAPDARLSLRAQYRLFD